MKYLFLIILSWSLQLAACSPKAPTQPERSFADTSQNTFGSNGAGGGSLESSVQAANCPANKVSVRGVCQGIIPVYRCVAPIPVGKEYINRIYVTDRTECAQANYSVEGGGPYFNALAGGDKQLYRWYTNSPTGFHHYYLQPEEDPGNPYAKEGPVWKISGSDFGAPASAAIYRCIHRCVDYSPQAACSDNQQWISLDNSCEGTGTNGGILGYVGRP